MTWIKEQGREENTDDLVLDVINNLILKHQGVSLNYSHIGRTHRVGPPPTTRIEEEQTIQWPGYQRGNQKSSIEERQTIQWPGYQRGNQKS